MHYYSTHSPLILSIGRRISRCWCAPCAHNLDLPATFSITVSTMKTKLKGSKLEGDDPKKPKLSSAADDDRLWHDDWPDKTGPIDLNVHDLPHESSDVEWWYVNSHLKSTESDKELSLFACFFRSVIGFDEANQEYIYSHVVQFAITDDETNKHYSYSMLESNSKPYIRDNLDKENKALDPHLHQSIQEMLARDALPLPDMDMEGDVVVKKDALFLDYGGNTFVKDDAGCYHISLRGQRPTDKSASGCSLKIKPLKPATRNRSDGVVKVGAHGDDMFYYFITRNEVTGSVMVQGEEFQVAGSGWYDHEFGGIIRANNASEKGAIMSDNFAWQWLSAQLDNGVDISACNIETPNNDYERVDSYALTIGEDGTRTEYSNPHFEALPGKVWRSCQTFVEYPTAWVFEQGDIKLSIEAYGNPGQEFQTLISFPAYWEGRVVVHGTIAGSPVKGLGFLERSGYGRDIARSLRNLFESSAIEMRKEIQKIMPLESDEKNGRKIGYDQLDRMMGDSGAKALSEFPNDLGRTGAIQNIFEPLRDMYDRGGKAWRSQALLVCIDAVGGNSQEHSYLLPVPEFLHAGSLIIDDIQDKSESRRGKPCTHHVYGEALAINAGNFSYFVGPVFYRQLPDDKRLKVLDLFFSTMMSAHVGQGADIAGLSSIMPEVVATGNSELATGAIIGIHRLKSGIPVRHMAQSGTIIGDGTEEQIAAVGDYFEQLGVAFQIVDDVVNLTGFDDDSWKTCGEDIMEGKVTYPVALAFKYLDRPVREEIWNILSSKPQEKEQVKTVIDHIRSTGALEESRQIAIGMVENAWQEVVKVLPETFSKVIMRGSSLYILDNLKASKPIPDSYF